MNSNCLYYSNIAHYAILRYEWEQSTINNKAYTIYIEPEQIFTIRFSSYAIVTLWICMQGVRLNEYTKPYIFSFTVHMAHIGFINIYMFFYYLLKFWMNFLWRCEPVLFCKYRLDDIYDLHSSSRTCNGIAAITQRSLLSIRQFYIFR